jgi:hypothetical protein
MMTPHHEHFTLKASPSHPTSLFISVTPTIKFSAYGLPLLAAVPLPFLFTPGGSLFVLCGTVLVLPVSLVPPIPVFCGPLPAVAPEFVFCAFVAPVVPVVFEAPVVVLALLEPPGALELLPPSPPQPTRHSATASKSGNIDICRIGTPHLFSSIEAQVSKPRARA